MKNNYKGLSNNEVASYRKKYGSNSLSKKKKNSFINILLESFGDPIIKILLIALFIKIVFLFKDFDVYETLGIAVSIFLATFISALSEYGSEKAFEKLNEENQNILVKTIRNSKRVSISIEELVVNDIVYLEDGDKVPADAKIIEGNIYVDESSITGESKEKEKSINSDIFMGSIVTHGECVIKIINVGDNTYYGNIASLIQDTSQTSPLKNRLRGLASVISKLSYLAAFIIFLSYMFNAIAVNKEVVITSISDIGPYLLYGLTLSVAVVVMAVPEGLPMMITLVLSSNMRRMLKRNVLVRKLVGIETAGSINILFTDKTGTITEGKFTMESFIDTSFNIYNSFNSIDKNIYEILYQSLVYNNSSFINNGVVDGGNSTDKSILYYTNTDDKTKYKIVNKIPFNSSNKYSLVKTDYDNGTSFIKGSYEYIINSSSFYLDNKGNKKVLINKDKYIKKINKYTSDGYRVLALGMTKNDDLKDIVFIGFLIMKDNIREHAIEGIRTIQNAGIKVVMVTGDSKETAINVAKRVNIFKDTNDIVLTSEEFNNMNDIEAMKIIPHLKVLCRSLPQDKNRLVRISQEMNYIVGMTGDGVNDAPALKKSDVGFAMGSGTEVAKETSDIVILDNNIKSIGVAILYGRTIFKSIRKFIIFQLSVNICAVLLSIVGPFIGVLTPITVIQMLWVNMVMDTFAGLAFSFEPALDEYMKEPPKSKNEPILNKYMINQIITNGLFSFLMCIWFLNSNFISTIYNMEYSSNHLYTAFFGLFIFLAIFNSFNARTYRINILSDILKNKVFLLIIFLISLAQIILIYFGGELFRTTGLTVFELEIMMLLSFSIIPFDILRKIIVKKRGIARTI